MRWSAGVFVVLIGLVLVAGPACRKLSTENDDRNRPPDTYLTAAPVDSISNSGLVRIPHRFRAQWAGSDVDGEVVGFFLAVTETTVDQSTGRPFRLPAPRPTQYRFTTARESLFTFTVLEGRGTDREHALYVYSVDNQGKVDPTPAVTHFVSRDQNLPRVIFLEAAATGTIFLPAPGGGSGVVPTPFSRTLTDSTEFPQHAPFDTIPSGGQVRFAWKGYDPDFASYITGYLYKLVETEYVRGDSNTTSAEYGGGVGPTGGAVPIGLNGFRIRAIDEAGGSTQPDALRRFYVNFSPDTWLAGPDPGLLGANLLSDEVGYYFPTDANGNVIDFPGNPLTDTLTLLPAERPPTDGLSGRPKTIVEVRQLIDRTSRFYIRSENDTVAFGSQLRIRIGGSDKDSPYAVRGGSPDNPARLLQTGPPNGSPVAFQARIETQFANGGSEEPPFSTPFPNIDPLDPLNNSDVLFNVDQITGTGRAFVQMRAVDGDRVSDIRIGDIMREADSLAAHNDPLRSKIFTFQTNYNPGVQIFSPVADEVINPVGSDRFNVTLRTSDQDPDPANPRLSQVYMTMYFSIRARVYKAGVQVGPEENWQDPVRGNYLPEVGAFFPYTSPIVLDIAVPNDLPVGASTLEIEVVDNSDRPKGRIIRVKVPFFWRATS
jgi:hypothetical protein